MHTECAIPSSKNRGLATHRQVGSGHVESAIRRVINLRIKAPGTFWKKDMGEYFLFLRSQLISGRWPLFLQNVTGRYRTGEFAQHLFSVFSENGSAQDRDRPACAAGRQVITDAINRLFNNLTRLSICHTLGLHPTLVHPRILGLVCSWSNSFILL